MKEDRKSEARELEVNGYTPGKEKVNPLACRTSHHWKTAVLLLGVAFMRIMFCVLH